MMTYEKMEKYTVWEKVGTNIRKEFDSEPVYNKKKLKTKIKSCIKATDFLDKEMSKAGTD